MSGGTPEVLAAVDLTLVGRRVAERARLLAAEFGTVLRLLHVTEATAEAFIPATVGELISRHRKSVVADLLGWVEGRAETEVVTEVVKGSPAWEIVRAGKHAGIIIVGSSSVDQTRLGPVARRVSEAARTDVLVVKRQPRAGYRKVVAAVDLSPASEVAVERAFAMCPEGKVTVLMGLTTRFDPLLSAAGLFPEELELVRSGRRHAAEEALDGFAAQWGDRVQTRLVEGPVIEVIEETVRRTGADLVTVGSRGAGATKLVLLGTVAAGILDQLACDVLVARVPSDFRRP